MRKYSTSLKKKSAKSTTPRASKLSKKELARRQALKDWYFSLDEDTQIREIENLSIDDLHLLAWASTYENYRKGNWQT
ncbi:MAG TPA: hypothetical protein PLD20_25770 [Blastocatellia bacterium]|nr:hypothetical protein [Blastocatellia bacterium]HMV83520.1 hypothetical protein [Blastocatellia bacterium]HMX30453.1 hypothetical protein [Blastocatellia bacterium]HMY76394.1 hypothetical protein [Blastocatellia bacterium]HMZ21367.1 hypothetical protein [Blastocatellia bacterium]